MIVAIDGPAGAGKSTVARAVAERIGAGYLNTGAMYRAVALLALRHGIAADDADALAALAGDHDIRLRVAADGEHVLLDGEDVSDQVRADEITAVVSQVASHRALRERIVAQQRAIIAHGDWVADGRDIATVVAPDAEVKVFLTASPDVRAGRRHAELAAGGVDVGLADVLQGVLGRDRQDSSRAESPLQIAAGASQIDTSQMTIDEVVDTLVALIRGITQVRA